MPDLRNRLVLAVVFAVVLPVASHADQKLDDIARMMSLGGNTISSAEGRLTASLAPVMQRFAEAHPNIPPDALAALQAEVRQQATDLFDAIVAQVRGRYYADMTDDEVRAILDFYGTPAGQVFLRENNVINTLVASDLTRVMPALVKLVLADFMAALKSQTPPPQPG